MIKSTTRNEQQGGANRHDSRGTKQEIFLIEFIVVFILWTLQGGARLKKIMYLSVIVVAQPFYQTFLKGFGKCVKKIPDIGRKINTCR